MKDMEKLNQCLNCELDLSNEENFCPHCGQKNHATRLKARTFLNELVNSIFNVDGRIWVTLKAAIFNVGNRAKKTIFYFKKVLQIGIVFLVIFFI